MTTVQPEILVWEVPSDQVPTWAAAVVLAQERYPGCVLAMIESNGPMARLTAERRSEPT